MNLLQPDTTSQVGNNAGFSFSADWTNAVIAFCALVIAGLSYIIALNTYKNQGKLDREAKENAEKARLDAEKLRERNLDFQWYKEFAVAPNINHLHSFYKKLYNLQSQIKESPISDNELKEISRQIRESTREVRDTLLSAIRPFSKDQHDNIWNKIDELSEFVLRTIIDDDHKLFKNETFDKVIGSQIEKSKHETHALLYKYRGGDKPTL